MLPIKLKSLVLFIFQPFDVTFVEMCYRLIVVSNQAHFLSSNMFNVVNKMLVYEICILFLYLHHFFGIWFELPHLYVFIILVLSKI